MRPVRVTICPLVYPALLFLACRHQRGGKEMREKGLLECQQNRHCIQPRDTLAPSSAWTALGVIMRAAGGLPSQDTDAPP